MINRVEYVEKILEFGVDPSMQNNLGYTALHFSCTIESLEIFNLILQSDKIDIECKNYLGDTILHDACRSNFDHHFFFLIEKTKPNINAINESGFTPIYLCSNKKKFKKLVELGADLTIIGNGSHPFYMVAAFKTVLNY